MPDRPYLLLDVDGPLIPHRAPGVPAGYEHHHLREGERSWDVIVNRGHGVQLGALSGVFELVWATGWEDGANRLLGPLIGLPELPVIRWPAGSIGADTGELCWKTRHLAEWVGDRPFAWIDDEVTERDREYFATVAGLGSRLVHAVDPAVGLTPDDCRLLRDWALRLR